MSSEKIEKYRTKRDMEVIENRINGKSILDAGGGDGRIAISLAKKGYDVTLIDTDEERLEEARERAEDENVDIEVKEEDIKDLDFPQESFDTVIAMRDVLNYCGKEYEKAFAELVRVCKENGKIIVSCGSKYGYLLKNQDIDFLYNIIVEGEEFESADGFTFKALTMDDLENLFKKYDITLVNRSGDSIIVQVMGGSEEEDIDMERVEQLDEILSNKDEMLDFFDHIIVVGRKEKYINF
ncbi:MAG: class I SAM-dependent methyltransferase [Candidatus Aenigmatarchaeota archaeon]